MQQALAHFMPYVQEFWSASDMESAAAQAGVGVDMARLRQAFDACLDDALAEATLQRPAAGGHISTGKHGLHSEHLGFVLAEMQSLTRAHPEGVW
jgi:ring-1,2-phenylacetyl-CoA epoxidase subunit PaaC